jgi:hypothetical protein
MLHCGSEFNFMDLDWQNMLPILYFVIEDLIFTGYDQVDPSSHKQIDLGNIMLKFICFVIQHITMQPRILEGPVCKYLGAHRGQYIQARG